MCRLIMIALLSTLTAVSTAAASDKTEAAPAASSAAPVIEAAAPPTRGLALSTLYVSYAGLQAYDIYSTRAALRAGGREMNPMMTGIAGHLGATLGVKMLVSSLTIATAESMWRRQNRAGAIVTMALANGVMAAVAARNATVLGGLR